MLRRVLAGRNSLTLEKAKALLQLVRDLNATADVEAAVEHVTAVAAEMIGCEACSVLLYEGAHLVVLAETETGPTAAKSRVRLPSGDGIAGQVLSSGTARRVSHVQNDPTFLPTVDQHHGVRTTSMICLPVRDETGETVALLQAINKRDEHGAVASFTQDDEELLGYIADDVGVVLRRLKLMESMKLANARVSAMVDILRSLRSQLGANSVIYTLSLKAPELVDAERATVYMHDTHHHELMSMVGDIDVRIPVSQGIAGDVARRNRAEFVNDPYSDARFDSSFDEKNHFVTRNMLVLPIPANQQNEVAGVLQLINKKHGAQFTEDDLEFLETFAVLIGPIIERSTLYQHQGAFKPTRDDAVAEASFASTISPVVTRGPASVRASIGPTIAEGEEDDEEDEDEAEDDAGKAAEA